jgi:hypothetical protein
MSGFDEVLRRGAAAGEARAARRRSAIAAEADAFPGVSARIEGDEVVLEGRGLLDRWLRDASVRSIGRAGS